jgi:hypothetical protein
MFCPQKENYVKTKTKTVQFEVYLTNTTVLITEASISATAFHLQEFRFLPHAVEALLFWDTYTAQHPRISEHLLSTYYTQNVNCCDVLQ